MKIGIVLVPALFFACVNAQAQPAPQPQAMGRQQGPPSPVVQPDSRVTFNLLAPNATAVTVTGDYPIGTDIPMTKDDKGVWSVTVGPLREDFYAYHFTVDGVTTLDPRNVHIQRDTTHFSNWAVVPGPDTANYEVNDVPHGRVAAVWYPSPSLKLTRRALIYTPPSYETSTVRYPVLYLLHGGAGDEDQWNDLGRATEIIENLIDQGKAVPMIVVMGNGNAWETMTPSALSDPPVVLMPNSAGPQGAGTATQGLTNYPDSIVTDLIPYVDKNFRTKSAPQDRAIAGLSMGGAQSAQAAFAHPEQFGWVGLFSSAAPLLPGCLKRIPMPADSASRRGPGLGMTIDPDGFMKQYPAIGPGLNHRFKLLYLAVGRSDGLVESEDDLVKLLNDHGVTIVTHDLPDYGHDWNFWRVILEDFSARLFKAGK